jgi:glycosyltransferase involved in cell wall biosynthesis
LLEAIQLLKQRGWRPFDKPWKLVVAGEFYEEEEKYQQLIEKWNIGDRLLMKTNFIANNDVKYYFSAANVVIQPYRNATQSGVTPLAYHFEKPMIVTQVGALPDYVPHKKVGLVVPPDPVSLANAIEEYFVLGEDYFMEGLRTEKNKYSWALLVAEILKLSTEINKHEI